MFRKAVDQRTLVVLSVLLLAFSVFGGTALAQFRAGLQGTVTDTTGAVVPGVTVTITNNATGVARSSVTNGSGRYSFTVIPPGEYTVVAKKTGFKNSKLTNVSVTARQTQGLAITLSPGSVSQQVTVTAQTNPAFQTQTASISGQITSQQVQALPQIGGDPYELLRLAPGVFGDGSRSSNGNAVNLPNTTGPGGSNLNIFQIENQVPISANGQRLSENNFEVDGVSVNSLTWGGAAVVTPNQASVQEIHVASNSYSAQDGRNSGAQIDVITKSGTNKFHGGANFLRQTPGLNAYNKWGGPYGAPTVRVDNRFSQFGASLGGPIIHNKLFFMFSYLGLRENTENFASAFLPTPQFMQSVISARPNSFAAQLFSEPGIAPRVNKVLTVPCPTDFAPGDCQQVQGGLNIGSITGAAGQYVNSPVGGGLTNTPDLEFAQFGIPSSNSGNQYNARIDYDLDAKDTLFFTTYITHFRSFGADGSTGSEPAADVANTPLNSAYTLAWNRILSPSWINEARVNLSRFAYNQLTGSASTNFGIPRVEAQGFPFGRLEWGAPYASTTPGIFAENTIDFSDWTTKTVGNHTLLFGAEIIREQDNNNLLGGARPDYVFQGLWNLANSAPIFEQINANPVTGGPADAQRYLRTGDYAVYAQDHWQAKPNLMITYGLRWEYYTPLTEAHGQLSNIQFGSQGLLNSKVVLEDQLYNPQYTNFGPRFGFAFNPERLHNLVLRGGFGLYADRNPEALFENSDQNPPDFASYGICCGGTSSPFVNGKIVLGFGSNHSPLSFPVNPALAVGIDPATGAPNGIAVQIYGAQPNTVNPLVAVYSFDAQYRLPRQWVADVGYSGSSGHHLMRLVNQNYLYPNNPAFYAVYIPQPDVNANYNALLAQATRRFTNGFTFQARYTYSKSLDELSYGGPGAVTNQTYPQDLKSEYGPSDYDVTHYIVADGTYDLPFYRSQRGILGELLGGWELSGIETWHTGFPFTVKDGQSVQTPGGPTLAPIRPTHYCGCARNPTSNFAFMNPGVEFPGGGLKYFTLGTGFPGVGRNSFRGPHYMQTDASLMKRIRLPFLGEGGNLEVRGNFYNLFNQLNLLPIGYFSPGAFADNSSFFGLADGGEAGRVIELQAQIMF